MLRRIFRNVMIVACWVAIIDNGIMLALCQAICMSEGMWYLDSEDMNFVMLAVIRMLLAMALRTYIMRTYTVRQKKEVVKGES